MANGSQEPGRCATLSQRRFGVSAACRDPRGSGGDRQSLSDAPSSNSTVAAPIAELLGQAIGRDYARARHRWSHGPTIGAPHTLKACRYRNGATPAAGRRSAISPSSSWISPRPIVESTPFEGIGGLENRHPLRRPRRRPLTPKYGRLANEHAPQREALVYRILHAVEHADIAVRPARVTYVFTDAVAPAADPVAMLLEDDRRGAATTGRRRRHRRNRVRVGARAVPAQGHGAARVRGSDDRQLRLVPAHVPGDIYRCDERHPLWNVLALRSRRRQRHSRSSTTSTWRAPSSAGTSGSSRCSSGVRRSRRRRL